MTKHNKQLGAWGETAAEDYLKKKEYEIIGRNIRTPYGEIDLIAEKDQVLIFVEVKTRSTKDYGLPEGAITEKKLNKMIESAQDYLQENHESTKEWQLDVISIQTKPNQNNPQIYHIENVLS